MHQGEQLVQELQRRIDELSAQLNDADTWACFGLAGAMLAHEVRNALTPVKTLASVALDHPDDREASRRALHEALDATAQIDRIAASLLREAPTRAEPGPARLDECLDRALASLPRPLESEDVRVVREVEPGLELAMGRADLVHVLINLISNAAHSLRQAPAGNRLLTIRAKPCSTWNTCEITIEDTGVGLDERVGASSGAGLGLRICRRLIEPFDGKLELVPGSLRGARAVLRLPMNSPAKQAA